MDSELQRLRLRVRQLERELRALRADAADDDDGEPSPAAIFPPASALRRWSTVTRRETEPRGR